MGNKAETAILSKVLQEIKGILLLGLKVIYVLPFFAFGLWLIRLVYFPGLDLNASISFPRYRKADDPFKILTRKDEPVPRGHFHMIDAYVGKQESKPPICVMCHGTYAHGKDKKVRALLNMHTGFIDCSVCHVRQDQPNAEGTVMPPNERIAFLWVDRETGEMTDKSVGEYGKYPATIYPIRYTEKGPRQVLTPINTADAQQFLKMRPERTPDQVAEARKKLHASLSEKPVVCADCHRQNGYLDFEKLGFPKTRVDHLVSSEIVGMLDKYKTFHLPEVIDFRGGQK